MATIRDIAREAAVSTSTVSLALKNNSKVSAETRKRIFDTAERLRYRPNSVGRPSKDKRVGHVGIAYPQRVVIEGHTTNLALAWIEGMRQSIISQGGQVSVFGGAKTIAHDAMLQRVTDKGELDGVLLLGISDEDGFLDWMLDRAIPTVVINRRPGQRSFSYVTMDNYGAGRQGIDYLRSLGHERIFCVAPLDPYNKNDFSQDRRDGACAALANIDTAVSVLETETDYSSDRVEEITEKICASQATAAFVIDDNLAVRCIDALERRGVRVPQDLSVLGYDDVGIKTKSGLEPSSISHDKRGVGRAAANMLIELLAQEEDVASLGKVFNTEVVVRDTTLVMPNEEV